MSSPSKFAKIKGAVSSAIKAIGGLGKKSGDDAGKDTQGEQYPLPKPPPRKEVRRKLLQGLPPEMQPEMAQQHFQMLAKDPAKILALEAQILAGGLPPTLMRRWIPPRKGL